MRLRPGENDGVEAVEDPDGSDTTTFRHGFSLSLSLQLTIVTTQNVIREERELRVIEVLLKFLNASSFNP